MTATTRSSRTMTRGTYIFLIVSILTLIVPDILYNIAVYRDVFSLLMIVSKACLAVSLGLLLMIVTGSFFWSYMLVGLMYLVSSVVETVNVILLDQYTTVDTLKAIYYTTNLEINGFTGRYGVYFLVPAAVILIFLGSLYLAKTKFDLPINRRRSFYALCGFGMIAVAIPTLQVVSSPAFYEDKNLVDYIVRNDFIQQHPFSLYYRTYEMSLIQRRLDRYREQRDAFSYNVANPHDPAMPRIVIMLIGEGMRYGNWSINGYSRSTSPRLAALGNIVSFEKHYANANNTSNAIPLLLTNAGPANAAVAHAEKSILSLFKEAGYESHWIACQNISYLENESEADSMYRLYRGNPSDMDVIPIVRTILDRTPDRNVFLLINLIGNHGKTPDAFNDVFRPNSSKQSVAVSPGNATVLINDYDNMVLSQDFVLGEVIRALQEKHVPSLVAYTSDHGVNLFDVEGSLLFGYGSSHPTEKELHIPLFLWGNDEYVKDNAAKYETLKANTKRLSTNDNVFFTLSDLANIQYRLFNAAASMASRAFVPDSVVLVSLSGSYVRFQPPDDDIAKR